MCDQKSGAAITLFVRSLKYVKITRLIDFEVLKLYEEFISGWEKWEEEGGKQSNPFCIKGKKILFRNLYKVDIIAKASTLRTPLWLIDFFLLYR